MARMTDLQDEVGRLRAALAQAQADICSSCCMHEGSRPHCPACDDAMRALAQSPPESAGEPQPKESGTPSAVEELAEILDELKPELRYVPNSTQVCEHEWECATLFDTDNTETHGMDCVKCLKFVATQPCEHKGGIDTYQGKPFCKRCGQTVEPDTQ